eukprot:609942_1
MSDSVTAPRIKHGSIGSQMRNNNNGPIPPQMLNNIMAQESIRQQIRPPMLGPLSNNNIPQPRNNHATTQPQMNRHVRNVVSPMPNNNLPSPMHRYKRLCSKSITQLAKRIARDMYETSHGGKLIRIPFAIRTRVHSNGYPL